jgi:hypothetical protein
MSSLSRTDSLFVAPSPRTINEPNMSLAYDHRQKHPDSLYTDENFTHFNTPNGVVNVPRPLILGSDDWKIAQFALKKTETDANGEKLTAAQIKRTKQGIAKAAKSYNDKQLAEEKHAQTELLRKQRRKDAKKQVAALAKKNKEAEKHATLTQEANTLYDQCNKLNIPLLVSPSATVECVIEMCQYALLKYMKTPLTKEELKVREEGAAKQKANISADARATEIFRVTKTHHIAANQMVEGEDGGLSMLKKKNNNKQVVKNSHVQVSYTPEVTIDWDDEPVVGGGSLTKKQMREIAYNNNLSANSA